MNDCKEFLRLRSRNEDTFFVGGIGTFNGRGMAFLLSLPSRE